MAMNPLPPQAYTRETLQEAYQWLLTQDASIKEMASNQDILVSLYLKARRNGPASLETPSIQSFKKELKSLARLMGDFQEEEAPSANASSTAVDTTTNVTTGTNMTSTSTVHNNPTNTNVGGVTSVLTKSAVTTKTSVTSQFKNLDEQSYAALVDVQNTLNLSSETEALRALIALGYKAFQKIKS